MFLSYTNSCPDCGPGLLLTFTISSHHSFKCTDPTTVRGCVTMDLLVHARVESKHVLYIHIYIYIHIHIYIYGLWLWVMVIHPMPRESLHIYVHIYIYIFQWIDHARTQKKALLFLTTKWHISHPTGPTAPQLMASAKAREWSSTKALALKSHRENV